VKLTGRYTAWSQDFDSGREVFTISVEQPTEKEPATKAARHAVSVWLKVSPRGLQSEDAAKKGYILTIVGTGTLDSWDSTMPIMISNGEVREKKTEKKKTDKSTKS
jgi:hypothetical protein